MEEKLNKYVEEARKFAERILGLELKFGELYELRQDVEFTIKTREESKKAEANEDHLIDPAYEASLIFMNRNYETQIYSNLDLDKFNM